MLFASLSLIAWAFLNYFLGNRFYAIFVIIYVFIIVLFRLRSYAILFIPLITIVFFNTNVIESWAKIKTINLSVIEHPSIPIKNIFSPNTGQEVLDRKILWMLSMIQNKKLKDYQLSNGLDINDPIKQRIVESAWPIKLESKSKNIFLEFEEINMFPKCEVVEQYNEELAIVHCP